jgi:hypothetical protein
LLIGDARGVEDVGGGPPVLDQQREQDVLGADEAVAKPVRLVAGTGQGPAGRLCEMLAQSDVRCLSMAERTDFRLAWRRS